MNAQILDPCCGSKMMWFDRQNPNVVYGDIRKEEHTLCDGRSLVIEPDVMMDFRNMPFNDGQFTLVVFDPPHLVKAGKQSWLAAKYGKLSEDWREDIRKGFAECFRVLSNGGVLIFKWNETQIKVSELLELTDQKPLFGHISGKDYFEFWKPDEFEDYKPDYLIPLYSFPTISSDFVVVPKEPTQRMLNAAHCYMNPVKGSDVHPETNRKRREMYKAMVKASESGAEG